MALKYYDASRATRTFKPKDAYYDDFAAIMDLSFDNAPNVAYNEVEYEQTYGEEDFAFIDKVRIDTIVVFNTGIIPGDDYKTFVFTPDFPVTPYVGMKFRWKDNYWLVINTNQYESMVTSAEVRRCNNVLRFFDEDGTKIYEPCIMDYTLRFANNNATPIITVGKGEQKIWCQRNKRTSLIKANDRFLFGTPERRVSFRVYGGGIKNYQNAVTMDDNSPNLTEFYVEHYQINDVFDDLQSGFANAYFNEVSIKIEEPITQMNVGDKVQLIAHAYKSGEVIDANIVWSSDNPEVAEIVDGSYLQAKALGSTNIKATLFDNEDISSTYTISVIDGVIESSYELVLNPSVGYVLEGENIQFAVYLYRDGEKIEEPIAFRNLSEVPKDKYEIVIDDDNHFTVYNKGMYMLNPLKVECSAQGVVETFNIQLRGLY